MKRTPPPLLLAAPLLLGAALLSMPASALPIIDVSISAGLNHSRVDSFAHRLDSTQAESFTGTEPRVTFNASITTLLGVELGWSKFGSDVGTATLMVLCPGSCPSGVENALLDYEQSGSALWLAYAPSLRLGSLEIAGKLGAARVSHDFMLGGADAAGDETEVLYGVAGTYWFRDAVGLRLDAERIGGDVAQLGLSLTVGF